MKRIACGLATAVVAFGALSGGSVALGEKKQANWSHNKADFSEIEPLSVEGELLVEFRRGVAPSSARSLHRELFTGAREHALARGVHLVRLPQNASAPAATAAYERSPLVAHVEPNLITRFTETVPNDPFFSELWGLRNTGQQHVVTSAAPPASASGTADADIDASDAWDTEQGDPSTVVAVMDSGVDVAHPDLAANIWINADEVPGNGVDDDNNGYVDDVNGWDFGDGDATLLETNPDIPLAERGHGTHVAGTIAAVMNNSVGVAGVCPSCKIMVLKVGEPIDIDGDGRPDVLGITVASEIEAFAYAAANGAAIVNGSFGRSLLWSQSERNAIEQAGIAGVLTVLAAGNENGDNDELLTIDFDGNEQLDALSPAFPSSYTLPTIVSVAASNHNDELGYDTVCASSTGSKEWPCTFSNWGHDSVDLAAPGVDVLSTLPGGYGVLEGTSMAAPHVAGAAGLVKSFHPEYSPVQLKNALLNSAEQRPNLGILNAFPDSPASGRFVLTGGRLNAAAALNGSTAEATPAGDGNIAGARSIVSSATGALGWPEDSNDVLKRRLRRGARYRVVLNSLDGVDLDLYVWSPGTREIWQLEDGCLGGPGRCKLRGLSASQAPSERLTFRATKSKVYYFQATAFVFSEGDYRLTIKKL